MERDPSFRLPRPSELGGGNPLMLFLCLSLLIGQRDKIMKSQMGFDEIAIHFDQSARKHNFNKVRVGA